eukprot:m.1459528 g.1459528  ORF g.1459528 m.1459528 type:complete len:66 (+) comp25128_c0_seq6:362-559(+)
MLPLQWIIHCRDKDTLDQQFQQERELLERFEAEGVNCANRIRFEIMTPSEYISELHARGRIPKNK